ncbi:hypothetical protein PGTUg99_029556 [Puccinia graminis f. sp. tritici]|uniref:Uncharacterized protein n=1 Tax=Puccinia graminis f. sp. tritici TaxID=56615 RepID=A0A5B0RW66_PUCGR|nr:hypothetical protein PGTUg99_029556 [Puccinia graminis f. sp. tritici]
MINPKPSIQKKFSSPLYTTELHERRLRRWASARSYRTIQSHNQAPSEIASGCVDYQYVANIGSMTGSSKIIPTGESGESGDGGKPHSSTLYIGFELRGTS